MKILAVAAILGIASLTATAQDNTLPPQIPPVGHPVAPGDPAAEHGASGQMQSQGAVSRQSQTNNAAANARAGGTNTLTPTGRIPLQAETAQGQEVQIDLSVTNTLATLPPAHSNSVVQLTTHLSALQSVAVNLSGAQTVQINIQQNPQIQPHIRQLSGQITALARGSARPSPVLVQRLASDLVRAMAPAQLQQDRLLVLAIVIDRVANAQTLTTDQLEQLINTTTATLQSAGVPMAVAHPITCDLHAMAYEIHPALAGQ